MTYITIDDMAAVLKESRSWVRDTLVKRADFPRPALVLSRKVVKWDAADFDKWQEKKRKEWK